MVQEQELEGCKWLVLRSPWFSVEKQAWMVHLNGKKVRLAGGRKSKKLAEQRFLELRFLASKNPHPSSPEQTVASVIELYEAKNRGRLAPATFSLRHFYLQSFAEFCGWKTVLSCSEDDMEAWLDAHPEWASAWTKCSAVLNVTVAFNWAAKKKINRVRLISENPFKGVTRRPGLARRDMQPEEFQSLLRASAGRPTKKRPSPAARFRQVLVFLWLTGCRPKEAATLHWSDVNFAAGLIVLKEHKTIRTQTTPKPRIIPMDAVVIKLLLSIKKRNEGDTVFLTFRRTPWNRHSLSRRVRRAREKAGISNDVKLYGTRHAFGTRGILNGCDVKTLSTVMGHTTIRQTEHYLHLADQKSHLASAMQQINGRRPGSRKDAAS